MKKTSGITIISLIITIIVLLIITSIAVYNGSNMIKKVKLEELRTNMLLIQGKAREYVEEANFKLGIDIDSASDKNERIESAKTELKGTPITNVDSNIVGTVETGEFVFYYELSKEDLNDMGLDKIELDTDEKYIVKYDINNLKVAIYNTIGYNGSYSLEEIENIED